MADAAAPDGVSTDPVVDACVIVAKYDESASVTAVVTGLRERFDTVVCVDDGSSDGCGELARRAGATVLTHAVNLGQGAALRTGIDFALADARLRHFVTFDADGQHRVADAAAMLRTAREGQADVVLGSRFLGTRPAGMPWTRRMVLRLAVRFTNLTTGLRLTDTHNGLRVLNRRAAERLRFQLAGMAHASELLTGITRNGLSVEEHGVAVLYTAHSLAKGQPSVNAVNIVFDLFVHRLRQAR
jgi:glycosyltransferase involved in cell wall biosynthesis